MEQRTKSIGYGIILLWMFWPFFPVIAANIIAAIWGCDLDGKSPCVAFGNNIGKSLYNIGFIGYFGMATFPSGILALIAFSLFIWWRGRTEDRN